MEIGDSLFSWRWSGQKIDMKKNPKGHLGGGITDHSPCCSCRHEVIPFEGAWPPAPCTEPLCWAPWGQSHRARVRCGLQEVILLARGARKVEERKSEEQVARWSVALSERRQASVFHVPPCFSYTSLFSFTVGTAGAAAYESWGRVGLEGLPP